MDTSNKQQTSAQAPGGITPQDVREALLASKPSASQDSAKYKQFDDQFGQAAS